MTCGKHLVANTEAYQGCWPCRVEAAEVRASMGGAGAINPADLAFLEQAWGAERLAALVHHMAEQARLAIKGGEGEISVHVGMRGRGVREAKVNGHAVLTKGTYRPDNPS